jgi:hypothetical protein
LLEGGQLGLQVAAPRQRQDRDLERAAAPVGQVLEEAVTANVHVDDGQMGMPVAERRRRLREVVRFARDVDPVVER